MYNLNKKIKTFAITTFTLLALTACSDKKEPKEVAVKMVKLQKPKTVIIQHINPEYEVSLPAELQPYEEVAVYAKVNGFVEKIYVERGQKVTKGQLLAQLVAPEMNQKYISDQSSEKKSHSDYLYAKQAYERMLEASKTIGAVAAIEVERSKSAMESAQSSYRSASAGTAGSGQLQKYLRITAPFDGIITSRNISVGALAGTGSSQPLFMIAQGNRLRLTLALPEKHAASIRDGMPATFTISSQPGKIFETKLSRSSGFLNRDDRSLTIEFDVDNASGDLQGGDYAQVKLKLQRKAPSYWVKKGSILNTQSGTFVLTFNNNEIKKVAIKEGIKLDTIAEVFGEFSNDDLIVVKPSEEMK
ncbi:MULTISPECIES: efflux RND transporter periplasmic adaptor subunit [Flavobacterium]|jgi:membrane fusion protein (multidrug efflux system)|uniref:Efflux RND transporter periplasmic adaptor subunit n=1 Tax=Flavobacterium frigidarium TaxID=99286 RepID=A0ABV4KEU8_9FLAO|nr:efflux RND transporter periplasmic adaptor subunit [Flavobacterium sp.]MDG2432061.1 efflux RND transporter periplasmic adaptor subunit [Flavobacterium sp.]